MPNKLPPVKNRFSSTHQPKHRTPRGPSLDTLLRKMLTKKIRYEDPTTKTEVKGEIAQAIVLREVYNALEGDQRALEYIIDRIDGKIIQKLKGEGFGDNKTYVYVVQDTKGRNKNRVQILPTLKPAKDNRV